MVGTSSRTPALSRPFAIAIGIAALAGCSAPAPVTIQGGDLAIVYRPGDGTYDLLRGGVLVIQAATADALVDDGSGRRLVSFARCARSQPSPADLVCTGDGVTLHLQLAIAGDHVTARLTAENNSAKTIKILRLAPVVVDAAAGGALFLGPDPAAHRILENGRFVAFDQTAQLEAGDVPRFSLGNVPPIPLRGNSVSNWNHIVADLADPSRSIVAGYLTFERSIPTLGIAYDSTAPRVDDGSGRRPFTTYTAESAFLFHGKPIAPHATLPSELLYLDPLPRDPLEALERYATAVAAEQKITPWPKRGAGHEVPNGWCSWSGGDSTGGYGHDIDQALIALNRDVVKRQLAPFGMSYFQIDDGWQIATGDWQWKPAQFPGAGPAESAASTAAGLKPGLWIAPFSVSPASSLAKQHPEWLQPAEDGAIGMFARDRETIDLSNPEVITWVRDLFTGLKNEGWKWAKVDFTYYDVLGKPLHDPSLTNIEAWRGGWRAIRDGLGPDVFLVGVGIVGSNIGVLDGMRTTLDNGPKWDEESPDDVINSPRAFKGTVRTASRRWFYQNRIWVNHYDLLFFRSWPDLSVPRLSLEESRTFATWIGLGGGVVKLGDRLADLDQHPEWIDVARRLLPAWPDGARPLDVLTRDYPEQHRLHVAAPAGEWEVVGLLHWGRNRDWSTSPPTDLDESPRTYTVDCPGECLAYEFWSEKFLGKKSGPFPVTVEPRRAQVLALRKPTGAPQLLGTNRHLTQGATDLGPIAWDPASKTLSGTLLGATGTVTAPWEYHLAFYAPTGFTLDQATVDGVMAPAAAQVGEVVTLRFTLPDAAQGTRVGFRIAFR